RLRPLQTVGLETAIHRLVAFWQNRFPETTLIVRFSIDENRIGDEFKDTIYRVIQEGVSNAIRHGGPTQIEIDVLHGNDSCVLVMVTDDGTGVTAGKGEHESTRLGLIGMRERVMAMAGSLSIVRGHSKKGLSLIATLPGADARAPRDQSTTE